MIKTLTKHGNSAALVIERPILDLLGATIDTAFEVVTDGQALILYGCEDERLTIDTAGARPHTRKGCCPGKQIPQVHGQGRKTLCEIL